MQNTFSSIRDMLNKRVFFCCPLGFLAMEIHPLGTMTNLGKKTKTAEVMGPALKLLAFTDFLRISGGKKTVSPISGTT